ncbi:MAG: MaoC family dehydratase [Acidimicrobiia bacterium]
MTATATVGTEVPEYVRTTDLANWNRYAAVNDEFVPIHMDDEAGRAVGFPGAFGMGNLLWSYLHNMLRDWIEAEFDGNGRIASMDLSFRSPNLRGQTVAARGTVTGVREESGATIVELDVVVVDRDHPDTVLAPGKATVSLA